MIFWDALDAMYIQSIDQLYLSLAMNLYIAALEAGKNALAVELKALHRLSPIKQLLS